MLFTSKRVWKIQMVQNTTVKMLTGVDHLYLLAVCFQTYFKELVLMFIILYCLISAYLKDHLSNHSYHILSLCFECPAFWVSTWKRAFVVLALTLWNSVVCLLLLLSSASGEDLFCFSWCSLFSALWFNYCFYVCVFYCMVRVFYIAFNILILCMFLIC